MTVIEPAATVATARVRQARARQWIRRAPSTSATRRFVTLGTLAFVAVTVGCLLSGAPAAARWWPMLLLLGVAGAAWVAALAGRPADWRVALACYTVFGLAGCGLELIQPAGPAYVFGYMALAGMGLALPRWPAVAGGALLLIALGATQVITSDHPGPAVLAIALGAGFLFAAAQFAAMSRDAHRRSAELLAQTEAERAAREAAAALAERSRLARDLHDVLAHTLSGLALQLEATRLYAARSGVDPTLVEQVTLAQKLARQGMSGAKQAIAALRGVGTPGLDDLPELIDDFRRATGLPVTLHISGSPWPLAPARQLAAYRTVQEALSNIAKHAPDAPAAPVRIDWTPRAVRISVCNSRPDPAGADAALDDPPAPGFGLTGIAERAAILGASVSSGPTPDGFAVVWDLPRCAAGPDGDPEPMPMAPAAIR